MRGRLDFFAKPAALLLAMLFFAPGSAQGDLGDFSPTIYSSSGNFELEITHQRNENTSAGRGSRSSDLFVTEQLRLGFDGFIYHPKFIHFQFRGAGGLFQERAQTLNGSFSESGLGTDYEFRTTILPAHAYNLELFTLSTTPMLHGQSSVEKRPTLTERGALFRYAAKPFFFNLSHITGAVEAGASSSEHRSAAVNGSYATGPFQNTAGYSRTDSSTTLGARSSTDYSFFENTIAGSGISLRSAVNQQQSNQTSPFSALIDTDSFSWREMFDARLPWNFFTWASYEHQKDSIIRDATTTARYETKNETKNKTFTLAHKLYDSVRTSYMLNQTISETSTGSSENTTNSVNGTYTKKIPGGRITIGAHGSYSVINREDAPLIVGETHAAALFGTFTLSNGGVVTSSIAVRTMSDAGMLVDLVENRDYVVEPSGNTAIITIISLPPEVRAGRPAGFVYVFQVSYTLTEGTVEFGLTTVGYSANLSLFDNFINPYYTWQRADQFIISGSTPEGPQESETMVVGVNILKAPFTMVSEYRSLESDINPSHAVRNGFEYARKATDTLELSAKVQHTKTVYGEGIMLGSGYTEQVSSLVMALNKTLPRRNLRASLSTSLSRRNSTFNTLYYAISGNLSWRIGNLFINMGASFNDATTTGGIAKQSTQSELFFMNVSRKLF